MVSSTLKLFAGIAPPTLRCIALDENDNVTLTWSIPIDSNNSFDSYVVFYQDGGSGPFSQLQTIGNYNSNSVTIAGNFSGTGSFYMVTKFDGGANTSLPSDTVSPILINLVPGNRTVKLNWSNHLLPSPDSLYRLKRSLDGGTWEQVSTADWGQNTFVDTVNECQAELKYQVEIRGVGGCLSTSNVARITLEDVAPPNTTNLICASVDTTDGSVNIEWLPSSSGDAFGYVVNYFSAVLNTATVFGRLNNDFRYDSDGINALIRPETLSVAPFDSCYDSAAMWYNQSADDKRFQTLFVDTIFYDRCGGKVALGWNMPTPGFPVGVRNIDEFRVYRNDNHTGSVRIATLTGSDSVFIDSGLVKGSQYRYVVAAYDSKYDKEALSNVLEFTVKPSKAPKFMDLLSVSNEHESGLNEVNLIVDPKSEATHFELYRTTDTVSGFQFVARKAVNGLDTQKLIDVSGEAGQTAYYYRVAAIDRCGDPMLWTPGSRSMHIGGFKFEDDFVNEVRWNEYLGFEWLGSSVSQYDLVRLTNGTDRDTIFTTSSPVLHRDTIYELNYIGGEVCYYAVAHESGPNQYDTTSTVLSNLHCQTFPPRVFVPNAFTPDGDLINDTFLPDVNFINISNYDLKVFNRSGQLIFNTFDPTEGWDGGTQAVGMYVYQLILENARGEELLMTGRIALIR